MSSDRDAMELGRNGASKHQVTADLHDSNILFNLEESGFW